MFASPTVTVYESPNERGGSIRLASFFHDGCPIPRGGPLSLVKDKVAAWHPHASEAHLI